MLMYHPELGTEHDFPDDPDCIAAQEKVGWLPARERTKRPGYEPEPPTYPPVAPADDEAAKPKGRKAT